MGDVTERSVGKHLKPYCVTAGNTALAAGTGDDTKVTGESLLLNGEHASGQLQIVYSAALNTAETLSFAIEHQDSDNGSDWDSAVVDEAETVAKTAVGAATYVDVKYLSVDLSAASEYRRYNITPNLSRGATDTVAWAAILTCKRSQGLGV